MFATEASRTCLIKLRNKMWWGVDRVVPMFSERTKL